MFIVNSWKQRPMMSKRESHWRAVVAVRIHIFYTAEGALIGYNIRSIPMKPGRSGKKCIFFPGVLHVDQKQKKIDFVDTMIDFTRPKNRCKILNRWKTCESTGTYGKDLIYPSKKLGVTPSFLFPEIFLKNYGANWQIISPLYLIFFFLYFYSERRRKIWAPLETI